MTHKHTSLQHNTLFIIGIPVLCMLFTGIYFGYHTVSEKSLEQLAANLEERTARQAAELNLFFGSMAQYADNLALTINTVGVLPNSAESTLTREAVKSGNLSSCTIAYAADKKTNLPLFPSPYTIRLGRVPVQAYMPPEQGASYMFQDWFLLPQLAERGMWTDPFYSEQQKNMVVAYGAPFYRMDEFLGVVSLTTTLSNLLERLQTLCMDGSQLVLVSKLGVVVVHPDEDIILRHTLLSLAGVRANRELADFAYSIKGQKTSGVVRLEEGLLGSNEYVAFAPVPQTEWILLSVIPETVVTTPLQNTLMFWMLWCVVGALALFVVIAMLVNSEMVVPLQRLINATSQLARGDFSSRVTEFSETLELRQLEQTFNSMAAQLDTSLRKEIEAGRAQSYAEEASRAKSDFLARMSHEIRTPMNAVLGFTHIALTRDPAPEQKEFLHKIQSAGKNMLSIINDILDFSKIEAGKLELENVPFRFANVATDIGNMFSTAAGQKGLAFSVIVDDCLPCLVSGDALRVNQILMNLCNNALKFTREGFVRVHIVHEGLDETGQLLVALKVQDSGIGISAEAQANLFTKFTQADSSTTRRFGGTGLGLAICRLLAELMGGGIELVSREGEGTTFTARIVCGLVEAGPADPAEAVDPATAQERTDPAVLGNALVLVAEDNAINQEIIAALLEAAGVAHQIAADGQEAVEMMQNARQQGLRYDLVLMDMQMPRLDGLAATRRLRELGFTLPILAMTANALTADRERCIAAGMNDHLAKPIEPDELYALLTVYLKQDM